MRDRIVALLTELDAALVGVAAGERLDLYHIGRSAVAWQCGVAAVTADVDVIRPVGPPALVAVAEQAFGYETPAAARHGLYLQYVDAGYPPVPPGALRRAMEVDGGWAVVRLFQLTPADLASTKLARFAQKDREDIRQLCDLGLIDPAELDRVTRTAWMSDKEDDGDPLQTLAFTNLRTVQKYLRGEITAF